MNRTSSTRSASSGTPYLNPKLISWIARRSERWTSPRRAKIRSRSSRRARSLVSRTTSACGADRVEQRRARAAIDAAIPRSSASGWRWRVSLNRRMRTSSRASRKMITGRIPRPSSAPRIAPNASGTSPARTSSTIAVRANRLGLGGDQVGEVAAAARRAGCRRRRSPGPRTASRPRSCRRPRAR